MNKLLKILRFFCLIQFFSGCFETKNVDVKTVYICNEKYLQSKRDACEREFLEGRENPSKDNKRMDDDIDLYANVIFPPKMKNATDDAFENFKNMENRCMRKDSFEKECDKFLKELNKAEEDWNKMIGLIDDIKNKISLRTKELKDISNKTKAIESELTTINKFIEKSKKKFVAEPGSTPEKESKIDANTAEMAKELNKQVAKINAFTTEYDEYLDEIQDKINEDMKDKKGEDGTSLEGIQYKDSKGQNIRECGYMTELVTRLQEFRNGGYEGNGDPLPNFLMDCNNSAIGRAHDGSDSLADLIETDAKMKNKEEANAALDQVTQLLDTMVVATQNKIDRLDVRIANSRTDFNAPDGYNAKYQAAADGFRADAAYYLPVNLNRVSGKVLATDPNNGKVIEEFEFIRKVIQDDGKTEFDREFDTLLRSWENKLNSDIKLDTPSLLIRDEDKTFDDNLAKHSEKFEDLGEGTDNIDMILRHLVEKSVHLGDAKLRETMNNLISLIDETAREIKVCEDATYRLVYPWEPESSLELRITDAPVTTVDIPDFDPKVKDNYFKAAEYAKRESDERKIRNQCWENVRDIEGKIQKAQDERNKLVIELVDAENGVINFPLIIANDTDVTLKNLQATLVTSKQDLKDKEDELKAKEKEKSDKANELLNTSLTPEQIALINAEIVNIDLRIGVLGPEIIASKLLVKNGVDSINALKTLLSTNKASLDKFKKQVISHPKKIEKLDNELTQLNANLLVAQEALKKAQDKFDLRIAIENGACQKKISHENAILKKFKGEDRRSQVGMLGSKIEKLRETLIFANNERKKNAEKHGFLLETDAFDQYIEDIFKYLNNRSKNITFGSGVNDFPIAPGAENLGNFTLFNSSSNVFSNSGDFLQMQSLGDKGLDHKSFTQENYNAKLQYEKNILVRKKADYEAWKSAMKLFKIQQNENPYLMQYGLSINIDYETWRQQENNRNYSLDSSRDKTTTNMTFDDVAGHLTGINGIHITLDLTKSVSASDPKKVRPMDLLYLKDSSIIRGFSPKRTIRNRFLNKNYNYVFGNNYLDRLYNGGNISKMEVAPEIDAPAFDLLRVFDPAFEAEVEAY